MNVFHTVTHSGDLIVTKMINAVGWVGAGVAISGGAVQKAVEEDSEFLWSLSEMGIAAGIFSVLVSAFSHIYTIYHNRKKLKLREEEIRIQREQLELDKIKHDRD